MKFTPEMFPSELGSENAALFAQKAFDEWFSNGIKVYGTGNINDSWTYDVHSEDRFQGILLDRKPIEPCRHEPEVELVGASIEGRTIVSPPCFTLKQKCKHCGVTLKAKWEAVP